MTDGYEFIRFIYEEDQEETTDCNSRSTRYRYGRYCAALWCGNTSLNSDVSFFSFPTDARLEKWIHYSNRPRFREDSMVTIRGRRLCADHFGVSAFTNRLTRNRLRIIACPTVKVTNPRLKKLVPPVPGRGTAPQGVIAMGWGVMCAVRSCNNRSMHGKQLSFFRFPRDPHLCREWIALCRRADLDTLFQQHGSGPLNLSYRVCSEHFQESDYRNRNLKSQGLKRDTAPSRNLGPRIAWQCGRECKHPGNSACFERKFFDDGQDSSTVPAPSSSTPGGCDSCSKCKAATQSLPPEPPTTDSAEEVDINSVEVITGIDADESVDACSASPPASPAFEYEQSPDNILPDPSEEDAEISACSDNSHLQNDGVESHASEGNDLNYSSPESDSDDEEATMMNIDTLPVEELRTSLRNVYRKYRRLKAVHLETTQLLEESSGKVERLEATLSELRLGHRDVS